MTTKKITGLMSAYVTAVNGPDKNMVISSNLVKEMVEYISKLETEIWGRDSDAVQEPTEELIGNKIIPMKSLESFASVVFRSYLPDVPFSQWPLYVLRGHNKGKLEAQARELMLMDSKTVRSFISNKGNIRNILAKNYSLHDLADFTTTLLNTCADYVLTKS